MRCIIVEDEPNQREILRRFITRDCPELELIGEAKSLAEARTMILLEKPELVFLDIELPGGYSIDLLAELKNTLGNLPFGIIFVTSHAEFITKAFDFSALQYLVKPIDESKFRHAVNFALEKARFQEEQAQKLAIFFEAMKREKLEKLPVPRITGEIDFVDIKEIVSIESHPLGETSIINLLSGLAINSSKSIGHYKKVMESDFPFFVIHQSIIINLELIKRFYPSDRSLVMINGAKILASKRRSVALHQYLKNEKKEVVSNNIFLRVLDLLKGR